jgi:hypothetical protein
MLFRGFNSNANKTAALRCVTTIRFPDDVTIISNFGPVMVAFEKRTSHKNKNHHNTMVVSYG